MSDHIEALITTAKKYKGDKYVQSRSGAPGKGIDESGLVMQSCYGAGVDLWPISPSTRPYNCVPKIMNSKLKSIKYVPAAEGSNDYTTMTRGDLIFFAAKKNGTPIHVAIYTGLGGIIHADPIKGKVKTSTIRTLEDQEGDYQYYVVGVRRIFN
jgi:cell wall-associated NlpC family hydrolase